TGRHLTKTLRPDWSGGRLQASMFAREAPVSCLYGGDDRNVLTFAVSDALDTVLVGSGIREEDGRIYNEVTFFSEPHPSLSTWSAELRLDRRRVPYWTALRGVSDWWAAQPGYAPAAVPEPARLPVYSTCTTTTRASTPRCSSRKWPSRRRWASSPSSSTTDG